MTPGARPVAGASRYRVCRIGLVWLRPARGRRYWAEVTPFPTAKGHLRVNLILDDGRRVKRPVHALVLAAFHGPRPPGMLGLHGDSDPANNRLANLRWGTPSENNLDAVAHGTCSFGRGSRNARAKLTESDIPEILGRRAAGTPAAALAADFRVSTSTINRIARRATWSHA